MCKIRREAIFLVLLFAMSVGFIGCSMGGESEQATEPTAKEAAARTQPAPAAAAPAQSPEPAATTDAAEVAQEIAGSGGQRLIRVSTIEGVDANSRFQRNVELVQGQRERLIELKSQLDKITLSEAREQLQAEFDRSLVKLNENNQKMLKTYGFSLTRNYVRVLEKTHIYMPVSLEEAARIEEQMKDGGGSGAESGGE